MKTGKHSVTIKDIANRLGLSTSTVSRALTDSWEIKAETRALVLKTAEEMDYHPNPQAQALATNRSKTIGLVVPELKNAFFAIVADGLQKTLFASGYQLLITQSDESPEEEKRNIKLLLQHNVDGIVISTTSCSEYNNVLFEELLQNNFPLIFINRVCYSADAPKVIMNNVEMAQRVVEHLISQGCRRIAHITGPKNLVITAERENGYIQALKNNNIPIDNELCCSGGIFEEDGIKATEALIESDTAFDAIFSFNDPVAIGAMKVLKKHGYRIPEDVAVTGFSESQLACVIEPNLTSVLQPMREIGETAGNLILKRLAGKEIGSPTIILDSKLNIRASSCRSAVPGH